MSVNYRLLSVDDKDILEVIKQPLKLEILYNGKDDPDYLEELLADLEEDEKENILQWQAVSAPADIFYLDGSADSINYLLTKETDRSKTSFPLNFLTSERIAIGEIGWGKANFYTSGDVLSISQALNKLDITAVSNNYNAAFFNEHKIYPAQYTWKATDGDQLVSKLVELITYVNRIAEKKSGFYVVAV